MSGRQYQNLLDIEKTKNLVQKVFNILMIKCSDRAVSRNSQSAGNLLTVGFVKNVFDMVCL